MASTLVAAMLHPARHHDAAASRCAQHRTPLRAAGQERCSPRDAARRSPGDMANAAWKAR